MKLWTYSLFSSKIHVPQCPALWYTLFTCALAPYMPKCALASNTISCQSVLRRPIPYYAKVCSVTPLWCHSWCHSSHHTTTVLQYSTWLYQYPLTYDSIVTKQKKQGVLSKVFQYWADHTLVHPNLTWSRSFKSYPVGKQGGLIFGGGGDIDFSLQSCHGERILPSSLDL